MQGRFWYDRLLSARTDQVLPFLPPKCSTKLRKLLEFIKHCTYTKSLRRFYSELRRRSGKPEFIAKVALRRTAEAASSTSIRAKRSASSSPQDQKGVMHNEGDNYCLAIGKYPLRAITRWGYVPSAGTWIGLRPATDYITVF